jgi:8-oxo-dGTP pyrophosphatase MutT (NUDIX family)
MTIQVARKAIEDATKLVARRTAANRLTMFHGTASGPNNSRLRSILKHGLIPTAPKAWADDPNAKQAGQRSRAAYGGTYFSANPRVAFSSVHKARGNDNSQYPVIITATIQPRAALPDEDDYTFSVDHAYSYATKTADHPHTDGYYYLCIFLDGYNTADLKEARQRFADSMAGMLKRHGVDMEPSRLKKFTDPVFDAEVIRRVANQKDDWYGFKGTVQSRALEWYKYHLESPRELSELPKELQEKPSYEEGEALFRTALDTLTKATRRLAIGLETHSKDAPERFRHVLRVMEPVTFRGRNRITSIVSLPDYYSRDTGTPVTVVSHYGDPTPVVQHLESEGYEVEVISPGAEARSVSAAAYTDETGKFWGSQGAGAVFLAEDTGRILIQHRSAYVNEPNTWGVIGGAIDAGEDPQEAMRREVQEETGYHGPMRVEKLYVFQSGKFRYTNFLVTVPHEFSPHHGWESQGHVWTTLDDLPEPLHFGFKSLLPSLQARLGGQELSASNDLEYKMQRKFVASTLRSAADKIDGEQSVKEVLDGLLARTGKTEELLATLADLYAEKAKEEQYAEMTSQMNQTEELLRAAAQAVTEVWEP